MIASQKVRIEIFTFLILTFSLSSIFYYLITSGKASDGIAFGLMWCPGIAAIVTRLIYHKNIGGLGWKLGKPKYLIFALFLPLLLCFIEYSFVWLSVSDSIDYNFAKELFSTKKIPWVIVNLLGNIFFALGEEIGWRGFLVRHLAKLTTFTKTAILSGLIWAIWHYPVLIFTNYSKDTPVGYALIIFTIGLILNGFIFAWFVIKSGSVWPAVVLHGAGNFFVQSVFDHLTVVSEHTKFLTGEFGIVGGIVLLIAAFIFWRIRERLPKLNKEKDR